MTTQTIDILAVTLIENHRAGHHPNPRWGTGLFSHKLAIGQSVVRPCIAATVPGIIAGNTFRRHVAYRESAFDHFGQWPEYFDKLGQAFHRNAGTAQSTAYRLQLPASHIEEIVGSYFKSESIYFEPPHVSSFELARAIVNVGSRLITEECQLLGIGKASWPILLLGGLQIERGIDHTVRATPCEASL